LGAVRADAGQIEQVINESGVNARRYALWGKLTIETSNVSIDEDHGALSPATQSGNYVMLAISDTAAGMDSETQSGSSSRFYTKEQRVWVRALYVYGS